MAGSDWYQGDIRSGDYSTRQGRRRHKVNPRVGRDAGALVEAGRCRNAVLRSGCYDEHQGPVHLGKYFIAFTIIFHLKIVLPLHTFKIIHLSSIIVSPEKRTTEKTMEMAGTMYMKASEMRFASFVFSMFLTFHGNQCQHCCLGGNVSHRVRSRPLPHH